MAAGLFADGRIGCLAAGFNPRNIDFRPNVMIKLVVSVSDGVAASGFSFESDALDLRAALHKGDNVFLLKNPKPGTFKFHAGSHAGTFAVGSGTDEPGIDG
ncbi:hypothetical protein [Cohnella sp. GCM10012308]|uniref:hypothetical protein n=1 Tax=Cohnella sp. GCM10012308 TaxID=3317329 RepID=UPI003617F50F